MPKCKETLKEKKIPLTITQFIEVLRRKMLTWSIEVLQEITNATSNNNPSGRVIKMKCNNAPHYHIKINFEKSKTDKKKCKFLNI